MSTGEKKNKKDNTAKATGGHNIVLPTGEATAYAQFNEAAAALTSKAEDAGIISTPKQKYDIENIKLLCFSMLKVSGGVKGVFADGKASVQEGVGFLFANLGTIETLKNIDYKLLSKEALDLDESEIEELSAFLNKRMKYENVFDSAMTLELVDATVKALGHLLICAEKYHEALGKHNKTSK